MALGRGKIDNFHYIYHLTVDEFQSEFETIKSQDQYLRNHIPFFGQLKIPHSIYLYQKTDDLFEFAHQMGIKHEYNRFHVLSALYDADLLLSNIIKFFKSLHFSPEREELVKERIYSNLLSKSYFYGAHISPKFSQERLTDLVLCFPVHPLETK